MTFRGTTLPLSCCIICVNTTDVTDEKFRAFYPGFSELHFVQCQSSGKNIDSGDGDTASL
jgi:hypothetical protein